MTVPASDNNASMVIPVTLPITKQIKDLKEMIADQVGLPPNKQQIKFMSSFLKDLQTLAAANVGDGATVEMIGRSRGGKR